MPSPWILPNESSGELANRHASASREQTAERLDRAWDRRWRRSGGLHGIGGSWRTRGSFGEDPHAWSQPPTLQARSPKFRRSEARIRNTAHADRRGRRGYPPRTGGCAGRGPATVTFHVPRGRKQELGVVGGW